MKWIAREPPKIDRIACPWLIARFIDCEPEFLHMPAGEVMAPAQQLDAGLHAISPGLSQRFSDDQKMLAHGLVMYDPRDASCKTCQGETHSWPPKV